MRHKSGLVKKGKFVRALLEAIAKHPNETIHGLDSMYGAELGPNLEYVAINIEKLIASREITSTLDKEGHERLTIGPVTGDSIPTKPIPANDDLRLSERATAASIRTMPRPIPQPSQASVAPSPPRQPFKAPVEVEPESIVYLTNGEKLPRNHELESIMVWAYLNDYPYERAVKQYCNSHKATFSLVNHGKKVGERLDFQDE